MIGRLRSERGTVLATTMILLGLMTMGALGTHAYVDSQTRESGAERVRESTFNVGETLLGSQVFLLASNWPSKDDAPYSTCSSAGPNCPNGGQIVAAFGGPDVAKGVTWQTRVLDNKLDNPRLSSLPADSTARCAAASRATPSYYDDAAMTTGTTPARDENDDCRLWVRAQASIDGRRRTFVGLVRVDQVTEDFPTNTITAGKVATGNSGNKVLIDTNGPDDGVPNRQIGPVAVRCSLSQAGCVDAAKDTQIEPSKIEDNFPNATALTPEALARLKATAKVYSSVTGCDPKVLSGPLVYIENANIVCTGNAQINAPPALPGVLIIERGTIEIGGTTSFHGLIHHANLDNSSGWLVRTSGTGLVQGSISVDGPGGVFINASALNVVFDPKVFSRIVSFGNAGIIQNTWREIVPAS